jgi:hypothetical protein
MSSVSFSSSSDSDTAIASTANVIIATTATTTTPSIILPSQSSSSTPQATRVVAETYFKQQPKSSTKINTLFAMTACLSDEDRHLNRVNLLLNKKIVTKTAVSFSKTHPKKEIIRRVEIIQHNESLNPELKRRNKLKVPKCSNWSKDRLIEWLKCHPLKVVEKLWVISKVKKYLDFIEKKANNEEKEKPAMVPAMVPSMVSSMV